MATPEPGVPRFSLGERARGCGRGGARPLRGARRGSSGGRGGASLPPFSLAWLYQGTPQPRALSPPARTPAPPPFPLADGSKHDLSTYMGRVAHFFDMVDLRNNFITKAEINRCVRRRAGGEGRPLVAQRAAPGRCLGGSLLLMLLLCAISVRVLRVALSGCGDRPHHPSDPHSLTDLVNPASTTSHPPTPSPAQRAVAAGVVQGGVAAPRHHGQRAVGRQEDRLLGAAP